MKPKKMTEAQKRKARNEYSREWKRKHKKAVRQWNAAWYEAKKRLAKAKSKRAAKKDQAPAAKAA